MYISLHCFSYLKSNIIVPFWWKFKFYFVHCKIAEKRRTPQNHLDYVLAKGKVAQDFRLLVFLIILFHLELFSIGRYLKVDLWSHYLEIMCIFIRKFYECLLQHRVQLQNNFCRLMKKKTVCRRSNETAPLNRPEEIGENTL